MSTSRCVTRFVAKYDCSTVCVIFYSYPISAFSQLKVISLNSIGRPNKDLILRFTWIRPPLSTLYIVRNKSFYMQASNYKELHILWDEIKKFPNAHKKSVSLESTHRLVRVGRFELPAS